MVYATMTTATDGKHAGDAYACEGGSPARPLCVFGGGGGTVLREGGSCLQQQGGAGTKMWVGVQQMSYIKHVHVLHVCVLGATQACNIDVLIISM
jgi:hypothetical protein